MKRREFLAGGMAVAAFTGAPRAWAQDYPAKPVRIMVSTAPGGMADTLGRLLASHLTQSMGQQFYVENRGGAGNIIGIDLVAKSPPDGYTFLVVAGTITSNHIMYKKMPYDVLRDLAPITQLVSLPNVLVVHPSQPYKTLADFIAAAKAKPGQINFASAGVGSNLHLSMELLKAKAGIDVVHVPYKGVGPAMSDLIGGHVASMVSNVASAKPHIDSGKLRPLGVTSRARAAALPDVPSMAEAGVKGYEVLNWFGLFAPAGTPAPIIARMHAEAKAMLTAPEMKQRLAGEGAEPIVSTPSDFTVFVKAEMEQWTEVGRAAKIQPAD
ncbi:MAG: tripartite tricarboxylate transporter substrate binding protein [Xanthobacteraceae bacterium]|nr:tripartite tricarboxylate transporter substrate binding protein [Xanthobacteraceae bacterium]